MKPHLLHPDHPSCGAARDLLTVIGSKWAVLVVMILSSEPRRFSDLQRKVGGITQKSLTAVLRELEKDGIVERTVEAVIPPHVHYSLTLLGQSLLVPLRGLTSWACDNQQAVAAARTRFAEVTEAA